jgi:cell division control protein 12
MRQEQQPQRVSKLDLRVHACLYFIRPTGHGLKPLDVEIMKRLGTRVNLIPIVAKADTLTPRDLEKFKAQVRSPSLLPSLPPVSLPSTAETDKTL